MEWHQFALVLSFPSEREAEWDALLEAAVVPDGIFCNKQHAALLLLEVEAEMEFLAIDRASQWLQELATKADPPLCIACNAQPAKEIRC